MSTILFAHHNYERAEPYRVLTTIERDATGLRVYKRASSPLAIPYVAGLIARQQLVANAVGARAVTVMGTFEADGRVSYPFIARPTLQALICEQVLQGEYATAYGYLRDWIAWIEALPSVQAAPADSRSLVAIYGDTLPGGVRTCLSVGLLDLTADNVLWDRATNVYYLVDHELVFPDPVPVELVVFRLIFNLCLKLRPLFESAAARHPLRQLGYPRFLVPVAWDLDRWIAPDSLPMLFRGEERLQSSYAAPVSITYEGERTIADRPTPNVAGQLERQHALMIAGFAERDRRIAQLQQQHDTFGRALYLARRAGAVWREQGVQVLARKVARRLGRTVGLLARPPADAPALLADDAARYARWIAAHEPDAGALRCQAAQARQLALQPLISIVTPVCDPAPDVLAALIESVCAQTYPHWELWLVNGSPQNRRVAATLRHYAQQDPRIHVLTLDHNRGIVGNTNAGLECVRGEFVAFVDHDDLLAPFALFEVAALLNEQPATDLIYSDHDLISADGVRRFQPLFKPDWSPAIMLSANYAAHLCVIRTALLRALGGLAPGSDGAQDWDLILRASERTQAIAHIPKVLYHWRVGPTSTAADITRKPYVLRAQTAAIARHLARRGLDAHAYFEANGAIRVTWPLSGRTQVSIVIPSRSPQLVQRCIDSILTRTAYRAFELIVVDTTPDGAISARLRDNSDACLQVVRLAGPFNYSAANNLGARQANGQALLFLNDDIEVIDPEWLAELVRWVEWEPIGVAGAKLLRADGRIQHAGVVVGLDGFAGHPFAGCPEGAQTIYGGVEWYRNYSAVTGACLMIRRAVFERVGGFDERFTLCGSDVELCLRVRERGYQVLYTPFARLRHLERATRGNAIPESDFVRSMECYRELLARGDPYYSPNLSPWSAVPRPRWHDEEPPSAFVRRYLERLGHEDAVSTGGRE